MNTDQFQRQFAEAINGSPTPFIDDALIGPAPMEQLLQVYKNNYRVSLTEYLEAVFPVTLALVGDDFFSHIASVYIDSNPPKSPQLDHYGQHLPLFIANFEAAATVPYLTDVAALEWQLDRLGNRRFQRFEPFPFEHLQTLNPIEQENIVFALNRNMAWQRFNSAALSIWRGVTNNDFENIDLTAQETVLFRLEPDHSVAMEIITEAQAALLGALENQRTITQITTTETTAEAASVYLELWIQQRIIVSFIDEAKESPYE